MNKKDFLRNIDKINERSSELVEECDRAVSTCRIGDEKKVWNKYNEKLEYLNEKRKELMNEYAHR